MKCSSYQPLRYFRISELSSTFTNLAAVVFSILIIRWIIFDEILNQIEIILLRHVQLLVRLPDAYKTVGVSNSNSTTISGPFKATEGLRIVEVFVSSSTSCRFEGLLVSNWTFSIPIDIPNVDIAISIDLRKDTWMNWWPLHIVHVLLTAFKCEDWRALFFILSIPKFYSPVHGCR